MISAIKKVFEKTSKETEIPTVLRNGFLVEENPSRSADFLGLNPDSYSLELN